MMAAVMRAVAAGFMAAPLMTAVVTVPAAAFGHHQRSARRNQSNHRRGQQVVQKALHDSLPIFDR
jgi:hypothetical protein